MSALYMKGVSDARKTPVTARGHKGLEVQLFYGSRDNSNRGCVVELRRDDAGVFHLKVSVNRSGVEKVVIDEDMPFKDAQHEGIWVQ